MAKLEAGERAPEFELEDGDGKTWRSTDLKGQKIILYFYPADDTPGCTVEACDFRDSQTEFKQDGYVVLGVSPQDSDSHNRFTEKYSLNFPLLIDADREVAAAYGATDDKGNLFKGIPLKVKRATFVINEDGVLEQAIYGIKARGHVDKLKESLGVSTS